MSGNGKCAIIVGASSGIGEALAKRLGKAGWKLALVARRAEELERVAAGIKRARCYPHDVTRFDEVPALFQSIVHDLGGFDMIVYCSGAMPRIAVDEYTFEKDKQMIDVNVLGAMAWLNQAAIRCERQLSGAIVGIGSVAGDRGRKGAPAYCASKAALHSYMESLRNRLSARGVDVITIKPGPVATPMTEGLKMPFMITAEAAAAQIHRAIAKRRNTAYVPLVWWPIMTIIKHIPSFLFKRTSI